MTQPGPPVSDDELHAYIDGGLDPARRLAVATYLATHPREAARAEAFRAQREGIHALFGHVLDQPVPERLHAPLLRRGARVLWRRIACAVGAASAVLVLAVGLVLGSGSWQFYVPFVHGADVVAPRALPEPMDRDGIDMLPLAQPHTHSQSSAI
jgi:anti-sigma factor RsiW